MAKKAAATKTAGRNKASKRKLVDTGTDTRFVRRAGGKFTEAEDVARSLTADRRKKAKTTLKSGQMDKGDH